MTPELEALQHRISMLENALDEVLELFEFSSPISIQGYISGELQWCELPEEAEDVLQRAELTLGWEGTTEEGDE